MWAGLSCFFTRTKQPFTATIGGYYVGVGTYLCDSCCWDVFGNQYLNFIRTDVADPVVLVGGNLYLIILLLYPLEIVRPGWLSLKRVGIVLLPMCQ